MSASIPANASTLASHRNLTRTNGVANGRMQGRGSMDLPETPRQRHEPPQPQPVNGDTPAENETYAPARRQNSLDDLLDEPPPDLKSGPRNPPAPYSVETPAKPLIDVLA